MLCKFIQQGMDVAETFQLDFKLNGLMEQFLSYKSAVSGLVKCDQIVSVVRRIGIIIKVTDRKHKKNID